MRLIDADVLKGLRDDVISGKLDVKNESDLIDMTPTALTEKDILALRAVAYGANTNKKLVAGFFTVYNDDRSVKEMIPFDEAIKTVYALLDKIMEVSDDS
jgi:hypothetical protein